MTENDTVVTPPKTVRPLKGAEYVLLQKDTAGWLYLGIYSGRDAEHAIRKHAETLDTADGEFVAVPRKSWKPLTVKAETVTTLKLEEVK